MMVNSAATSNEQSIYAALELSKNSWLLALQVPGRDNPSLHPLMGGDAEGMMAKLDAARQRVAKDTDKSPAVTLCYEAGYYGFWLARFLEQRGISCQVMEPASLQVNRRARRVKTDRSTHLFGLYLRRHLSSARCRCGPRPAPLQHRRHEPSLDGNLGRRRH